MKWVTSPKPQSSATSITLPDAHRLAYAVVEWRTTHHNASFQVIADGDRRCRVVWITDLLPDTLAELVEGFMEQGGAAIKRTLEARDVDAEVVKKENTATR